MATVNSSGKITAISDGNVNIVASIGASIAYCSVTVFTNVQASLTGSNYYLLSIDASTANALGSSNIAADYRPDGVNKNLYIYAKKSVILIPWLSAIAFTIKLGPFPI